MQTEIILASSSAYRKSLLNRLHIDFSCVSPDIDETRMTDELAEDYVSRLAKSKARVIAESNPQAIVIGSDQCAVFGNTILGKPGNHQNAINQLRAIRGETVIFHTGLCVMQQSSDYCEVDDVLFEVTFRQLDDRQIEHYLRTEQPYQCAGSFKSEGYGIALFEKMHGDDPTSLIGLPLIRLVKMLESAGVDIL